MFSPLKLDPTLWACGAMIRNRARPSELICGYCRPPWFSDDGLKSSTGWVVWAQIGAPTSRGSRETPKPRSVVFIAIPPEMGWLIGRRRSVNLFPFETSAVFSVGARAGGGNRGGPGAVRLGRQVAVIREGHEHRVAPHEVDPLERLGLPRRGTGQVFEDDAAGARAGV